MRHTMKMVLALLLLLNSSANAASIMRVEADHAPKRLRAELEAVGFVVVSIKPFSWERVGKEKARTTGSFITFDHDLNATEIASMQSVVDAHEGNKVKRERLLITIKNLTKLLKDEPATLQRVANLLIAIVQAERLDE